MLMKALLLAGVSALCVLPVLFFLMSHPLSMAGVLILTAAANCFVWGLLASSWYAFIVFILFVGALLVLFAFISSLTPNFKFSPRIVYWAVPVTGTLACLLAPSAFYSQSKPTIGVGLDVLNSVWAWSMGESVGGAVALVFLSVVLLFCLLAVIAICKDCHSALRSWSS